MRNATLVSVFMFLTACGVLDSGDGSPGDDMGDDGGGPGPGDDDDGLPGGGDGDGDGGGSDDSPDPTPDEPDGAEGDQVVFVTSLTYDGDLRSAGGGTSGLDGADKLCMLHAAAGDLPGTFRAWLSTSSVDAIDRITGAGPWKNLGGEVVFANRAQLQTKPITTVAHDEIGDYAQPDVWTATTGGREAPPYYSSQTTSSCTDWTSKSSTVPGIIGDSAVVGDERWTHYFYDACNAENALYCFSIE